jgi:ATP-dependent DNA ligase
MPGRPLFPPKPTRAWADTDTHRELIRDPGWIVEPKMDGDRCLAQFTDTGVELWSRHGGLTRFGWLDPLKSELEAWDMPVGVILDCELIATPKPACDLYVFDVPTADGLLAARREVLEAIFEDTSFALIHMIPTLDKATAYDQAMEKGWEGVVWKRLDSPYKWMRSNSDAPYPHWIKMKPEQDFGKNR